jgi:hypothetical protein
MRECARLPPPGTSAAKGFAIYWVSLESIGRSSSARRSIPSAHTGEAGDVPERHDNSGGRLGADAGPAQSRGGTRRQRASLMFFGMERLSASISLATVEKIGPSSEARAASQFCSRLLTVFSGIGCASQIVDVRAIRLEPVRVSIAQLALPQRPAVAIGVPGELHSLAAAAADRTFCPVSTDQQLDLSGHLV